MYSKPIQNIRYNDLHDLHPNRKILICLNKSFLLSQYMIYVLLEDRADEDQNTDSIQVNLQQVIAKVKKLELFGKIDDFISL